MPRMTIEFPEKVNDMLTELAQKEEVSKAEILRRALALYNYLQREAVDKQKKVSITDGNDTIIKDIIFS